MPTVHASALYVMVFILSERLASCLYKFYIHVETDSNGQVNKK